MSRLHRFIGAVVSSTIGFQLLRCWGYRHPHNHLYDLDGGMYMGRYRIIDEGTRASKVLQFLTRGKYHAIRLHHIMRSDHDRDLHSHPFEYRSFILGGTYTELFEDGVRVATKDSDGFWRMGGDTAIAPFSRCEKKGLRCVGRGDTVTGQADKFHRISWVSPGGVWTLFCMSKNVDKWGFLVDHRLVDSTRYFMRRGYTRDAIRALAKNNVNR